MKVRHWNNKEQRTQEREITYTEDEVIKQIIPAEPGAFQVVEVTRNDEKEEGYELIFSPVVAWAVVEEFYPANLHEAKRGTRVSALVPGWDEFEPLGLVIPDGSYSMGFIRTGNREDLERMKDKAAEFWKGEK